MLYYYDRQIQITAIKQSDELKIDYLHITCEL